MANTIITKNSSTASAVPTSGDLVQGELAVNVTDKRLFTENSGGTVVELGVNPTSITTGNLTASGTVTIPDNAISGDKVEGGTINAITINTLSGNVNVTGTVTADGLTVDGSANINTSGTSLATFNYIGANKGSITTDGINLKHNATANMYFNVSSANRMLISGIGDISFYEDTGTTPKFFWDASAESLGIGTSSPGQKLSVNGNIDAFSTTASPIVLSTSDQAAGFYPASLRMRRRGAGGTATPNGQTIGQIRFDGASVGDVYDNLAIIEVIGGTNAVGGMPSSMSFHTASSGANATLRMTLDSSGNLGLGVTPSAWNSVYRAIQIAGSGVCLAGRTDLASNLQLMTNAFRSSSGGSPFVYINTGAATRYDHDAGQHVWLTAPSGTAGNTITFNQAMTLNASGSLLVGTTTTSLATNQGALISSAGELYATHDGGEAIIAGRLNSDGDIIYLRKDGTKVGSIGSFNGMAYFASGDVGLRPNGATDAIYPTNGTGTARDSAVSFGDSGSRFKDLYLSGGVYVGGTAAANHLDDYEEGTWTPSLTASTSGTITTAGVGRYTKIGRTVFLTGYINVTAISSPVGDLLLNGFPFAVGSDTGAGSLQPYAFANNVATDGMYIGLSNSATTASIRGFVNGAQITTLAANSQNGAGFQMSITYNT